MRIAHFPAGLALYLLVAAGCNRVGFLSYPPVDAGPDGRDAATSGDQAGGDPGVDAGSDQDGNAGTDAGTDGDRMEGEEGGCPTWYRDSDGDGFGDPGVWLVSCLPVDGYTDNSDDCDDANPECWVPGQGCQNSRDLLGYWPFDQGGGSEVADLSTFGHHGAFQGNPQWVPGMVGQALDFDGEVDFVRLDHAGGFDFDGGSGSFSLSYWIKPSNFHNSPWLRPFELAYCPGDAYLFSWVHADGGTGFGGYIDAPPEWASTQSADDAVPLDRWTHVVYVVDRVQQTGQTWINGQQSGPAADMSRWGDGVINCATAHIRVLGGYPGFLYAGSLDEVRIYGRTLGAGEVSDLYRDRCGCCRF